MTYETYYDIPIYQADGEMMDMLAEVAKEAGASMKTKEVSTQELSDHRADPTWIRAIFTHVSSGDSLTTMMLWATNLGVGIGQALAHWDQR